MANAVLNEQYLASRFFAIDKLLAGLTTSNDAVSSIVDANAIAIQSLTTSLIRAAIVVSAVSASAGYPAIGTGSIKLLNIDDPTVTDSAIFTVFNFTTGSFSANAIVFVALIGTSYYIIKS